MWRKGGEGGGRGSWPHNDEMFSAAGNRWHRLQDKEGKEWCLGADSNHRHADFQSAALPTELPRPGSGDGSGRGSGVYKRGRSACPASGPILAVAFAIFVRGRPGNGVPPVNQRCRSTSAQRFEQKGRYSGIDFGLAADGAGRTGHVNDHSASAGRLSSARRWAPRPQARHQRRGELWRHHQCAARGNARARGVGQQGMVQLAGQRPGRVVSDARPDQVLQRGERSRAGSAAARRTG